MEILAGEESTNEVQLYHDFKKVKQKIHYPTCTRVGDRFVLQVNSRFVTIPVAVGKVDVFEYMKDFPTRDTNESAVANGNIEKSKTKSLKIVSNTSVDLDPFPVRFHPIWLHFDNYEYEARFMFESADNFSRPLQRSLGIAIVMVTFFTISYSVNKQYTSALFTLSVLIVQFLLLGLLLRFRQHAYRRILRVSFLVASVSFWAGSLMDSNYEFSILTAIFIHGYGVMIRDRTLAFFTTTMTFSLFYMLATILFFEFRLGLLLGSSFAGLSISYTIVSYFLERSDRITFLARQKHMRQQSVLMEQKEKIRDLLHSIYPREVTRSLIASSIKSKSFDYFIKSEDAIVIYVQSFFLSDSQRLRIPDEMRRILDEESNRFGLDKIAHTDWSLLFVGSIFQSRNKIETAQLLKTLHFRLSQISRDDKNQSTKICITKGEVVGAIHDDHMRPLNFRGAAISRAQSVCLFSPLEGFYVEKCLCQSYKEVQKLFKQSEFTLNDGSELLWSSFRNKDGDLDEFLSSNGDSEILGIEFEIPNQPMPEDSSFHQPNVKDALEELGVDDVGLVLEQAEVVQAEIISQAQNYRESIVVTRAFCIYLAIVLNTWGLVHSVSYAIDAELTRSPMTLIAYRYAVFSPLFLACAIYILLSMSLNDFSWSRFPIFEYIPTVMSCLYSIYSSTFHLLWYYYRGVGCVRSGLFSGLHVEQYFVAFLISIYSKSSRLFLRIYYILWAGLTVLMRMSSFYCFYTEAAFYFSFFEYVIAPAVVLYWSFFVRQQLGISQMNALKTAAMQTMAIQKIRDKTESIIIGIVPENVYQQMRNGLSFDKRDANNVAYIILHFSSIPSQMIQEKLSAHTKALLEVIDDYAKSMGIEPIKMIGDSYLLCCGLESSNFKSACTAIDFAIGIQITFRNDTSNHQSRNIDCKISLAFGCCSYGFVGVDRISFDVWGPACGDAFQCLRFCQSGQVLVSSKLYAHLSNNNRYIFEEIESINQMEATEDKAYVVRRNNDLWESFVCDEMSNAMSEC